MTTWPLSYFIHVPALTLLFPHMHNLIAHIAFSLLTYDSLALRAYWPTWSYIHFYSSVSLSPHVVSKAVWISAPLASSFLLRGHGSWLFNPITADWWHQVQSCPDLSPKPAAGISWDEEQWDNTDQSVWGSDRNRGRCTVDELVGANSLLWLLGIPPFNR